MEGWLERLSEQTGWKKLVSENNFHKKASEISEAF
jgi:hypothetical protein